VLENMRGRLVVRLAGLTAVAFGLAILGPERTALADAPERPAVQPSPDIYLAGYEQGVADAMKGKGEDTAIAHCELRRKEAEDLVAEQQPYMDRGDRYAHCLLEVRDAEAWGLDAVRTVVARCTAEFP
jgi:hypothetical protein